MISKTTKKFNIIMLGVATIGVVIYAIGCFLR